MTIIAVRSPQEIATKERCEELRLFILDYEAKHKGESPSLDLMVREMGVPEAAIRYMIGKLESLGLVLVISRNPLRIMIKSPSFQPPEQEKFNDKKAYDRFLDAEATRHQLGRFIGKVEKETGRGPTLRQMMDYLQYNNAGWVSNAVNMLVKRGLVQAGEGLPTKLTKLGRTFYGFDKESIMTSDKSIVLVPVKDLPNRVSADTYNRVGDYLHAFGKRRRIKMREIATELGIGYWTVNKAAHQLADEGLLQPIPRYSKAGIKLTAEGERRFAPPPEPEPAAPPEPEPQDARSPKVEEVHETTEEFMEQMEASPEAQRPAMFTSRMTAAHSPSLADYNTSALVLELIERGYTVSKR